MVRDHDSELKKLVKGWEQASPVYVHFFVFEKSITGSNSFWEIPNPFYKEAYMSNRIRKNKITFFVDDEERAAIKMKMQKMNMRNQSLYLRKMALEGRIIQVDYSVFTDIGKSISGVSRNINQIAKRINTTDNIYVEDMRQIKSTQEEIWRLLKSIESQLL